MNFIYPLLHWLLADKEKSIVIERRIIKKLQKENIKKWFNESKPNEVTEKN